MNRRVTETDRPTSYRLAPALGARLVGRSLVTLGVLVVVATFVGLLTGAGWIPAGVVTVAGLIVVALWAWWLLRRAEALRLTDQGYAVHLLSGVGVAAAPWSSVDEAVAASPGGEAAQHRRGVPRVGVPIRKEPAIEDENASYIRPARGFAPL